MSTLWRRAPTAAVLAGLAACAVPDDAPTRPGALTRWLEAGSYLDWPQEPDWHPSAGPHFGRVQVYLDPTLASSLEDGASRHPEGATAVKELYGMAASEPLGWAVMVKVGAEQGADSWYWYERYADERLLSGSAGAELCGDCHREGADFVLTPWPQPTDG